MTEKRKKWDDLDAFYDDDADESEDEDDEETEAEDEDEEEEEDGDGDDDEEDEGLIGQGIEPSSPRAKRLEEG
jgi:hypothetical protein